MLLVVAQELLMRIFTEQFIGFIGLAVLFDVAYFFFSSRRRHTRYIGDWSSDVCSSDLLAGAAILSVAAGLVHFAAVPEHWANYRIAALFFIGLGIFQVGWAALVLGRPSRLLYAAGAARSEERRVGYRDDAREA